jgi:hypothetical protein
LSLSHEGTPSPDVLNEASIDTGRQQHGPSDYQLLREANIAKNKQVLASLGLAGGGSSALKKKTRKDKRKKGEEEEKYGFCLFCNAFLPI